ncbi:hypothetical protein QT06_C0001G0588 [archaeon GW2011_AR15]|nr:hypothetical protein QT06_C0001G0588 [archaeon GW2011_AR15]MBS3103899.1 hypothetical protein [Candidatus Woesearchaeota archaeon]
MFIDVCFPKNNEEEFLRTAERLSIGGLCFVYGGQAMGQIVHGKMPVWSASSGAAKIPGTLFGLVPLSRNISKAGKIVYYYIPAEEKPRFHYPLKEINQVVMKDLKMHGRILGFSFASVLHGSPKDIEKIRFVAGLAEKYKVKTFFASFAASPEELRSEKEMLGAARAMRMKCGIGVPEDFLSADNKNF